MSKLFPKTVSQYHVFLASPGDVGMERQSVRKFFDEYNRQHRKQNKKKAAPSGGAAHPTCLPPVTDPSIANH